MIHETLKRLIVWAIISSQQSPTSRSQMTDEGMEHDWNNSHPGYEICRISHRFGSPLDLPV